MKNFVKELANSVSDSISGDRPELIEIRTQLILRTMVNKLYNKNIISSKVFSEIFDEINELYK